MINSSVNNESPVLSVCNTECGMFRLDSDVINLAKQLYIKTSVNVIADYIYYFLVENNITCDYRAYICYITNQLLLNDITRKFKSLNGLVPIEAKAELYELFISNTDTLVNLNTKLNSFVASVCSSLNKIVLQVCVVTHDVRVLPMLDKCIRYNSFVCCNTSSLCNVTCPVRGLCTELFIIYCHTAEIFEQCHYRYV